jgi:hypothetical protein
MRACEEEDDGGGGRDRGCDSCEGEAADGVECSTPEGGEAAEDDRRQHHVEEIDRQVALRRRKVAGEHRNEQRERECYGDRHDREQNEAAS